MPGLANGQRLAVSGASVGSGVLVAWAWNAAFPEVPMPVEVAAVVGAVIAPLFDVVVALRDAALTRLAGGRDAVISGPIAPGPAPDRQ
jgi:hypothetical protein